MQVLQLSDDQIAMLPEDQRASIMILKEQLARSSSWFTIVQLCQQKLLVNVYGCELPV